MADGPEGRVPPHNLEAEASVLGGILLRNDALDAVLERGVEAEDFYHPAHRAIFEAMVTLHTGQRPIDIITLADQLKGQERGRRTPVSESLLADLAARVPTAANVGFYARIVHEKSSLRRMIAACGEVTGKAFSDYGEAAQFLDWAESRVFQVAQRTGRQSYVSVKQLLPETVEKIQQRYDQKRNVTGVPTDYHEFDRMTAGLQPSDLIVLAARPSMGKAQPLDARVKTVTGWKTMGELRLGDELASVDGRRSRVSGLFPQGEKQIYRITFADGRSTECCDEHLWRVYYRTWPAPRVLPLAEIRRLLRRKRYQGRLWIETAAGEFGHRETLPVDPWVLGALLGDGCLRGSLVRFSSVDEELLARLASRIPEQELKAIGGCDYRIVTTGGRTRPGVQGVVPHALREELGWLGVWDLPAEAKFIPPAYLLAHREARLELLRGLLDTDGRVETWGSVRFCTASERLARDVVELVRSLGGTCGVARKRPHYPHRGERRAGRTAFVVDIHHPDPGSLVSLERKRERVPRKQRYKRLTIRSVEPTRVAPAQCITVTHPAHLYITDDYVVTHNTALALNIAQNVAMAHKIPVLVFSLEMSKHSLVERMLCAEAHINSRDLKTGYIQGHQWLDLTQAMSRLSEAPIAIDDSAASTVLEIRAKARRWRKDSAFFPDRDHPGFGLIVIDYLQLIRGHGDQDSREREISDISMGLKALAKELEVPVLALSQLNRGVEKRDDKRPLLSDLRESGAIEQDADVIVFIYRDAVYQRRELKGGQAEPEDRTAEIIIGKQRNGPTGTVELIFMREFTRFENKSPHDEGYGPEPG
jgi:replicative DNA helicase